VSIFQRSAALRDDIADVRQILREEHFPYEQGLRVYEALFAALEVVDTQADTFLKWSVEFPNDPLDDAQMVHFRMLELTVKKIRETLG
jgi:hypothetical protein